MPVSQNRTLGAFSLAALLVSAHYGLGFILGTAEQASTIGVAGSLYPISLGIGTLVLLVLAQFYWKQVDQIWTLLGNRYGNQVKVLIGMMAWSSMIGLEAVQLISGAFILKVLHVPAIPSMVALATLAMILSLLPVERASRIFQGLLLFNIVTLGYALWVLHGVPEYLHAPLEFVPALEQLEPSKVVSISLSTVLLILIDMKYQQFVVRAKDIQNLQQGCVLAGIVLLLLAFLPAAVVVAAKNAGVLPVDIDGKAAIPYLLSWVGGGADKPLGIVLILSLVVPALGVGSSILRMQSKTVLDLGIVPVSNRNRLLIGIVNALLGLAVALKGGSIINLIVEFYAGYVAAVWVPFAAYLLSYKGYKFSAASVRLSLFTSSISALAMLILTFVLPKAAIFGNPELTILGVGLLFGVLGLLVGQIVERYFPTFAAKK